MNNYQYQVGGCLKRDAPTYVLREADAQLYQALITGHFCYVLNSRQMGKSSLRVQMMHRLQREGTTCASIDMTRIGSDNLAPAKWYKGIIFELSRGFNLLGKFNFKAWWQEKEHLSNNQRLSDFIEEIILVYLPTENIFIFIDEIDSVLGLNFPVDDFFALIRYCYNQRAENPAYNRLAFVLFGVATPSDLIKDRNRTPFNIGKAIELQGFQVNEVQPLVEGLVEIVDNPLAVIKEILTWTSGQPFLTQKLCRLVWMSSQDRINDIVQVPPGAEAFWIEQLVQKQIINNWESQDEPEHLRTIRDRLLSNEQRAGRILGLYQQILQQGAVAADDSNEQIELLLSGLVVKRGGKLTVGNRIYQTLFNQNWIDQQLSHLRPYSETFTVWLNSNCQDESRLLRGQALADAQAWSQGKSLSNLDYHFLAASQELEKREVQLTLEAERKAAQILATANQTLKQAQNQAKRTIKRGLVGLAAISVFAIGFLGLAGFLALQVENRRKEVILGEIDNLSVSSELLFASEQKLDALITALRASREMDRASWTKANFQIQQQVTNALQQAVYWVSERNSLEGHGDRIWSVAWSPDGQLMASPSQDGTVKLWSRNGQLILTLTERKDKVTGASFSPDGKLLATASEDGTAKVWTREGQLIRTLRGHRGRLWGVTFSPDGQLIATASDDYTVKIWTLDGREIRTLTGHDHEVRNVTFSPDGQLIATASEDKTIKLWTRDGQLLRTLTGHETRVLSVKFSPNGQILASSSGDKSIKIWNLDGKEIGTWIAHGDEVNAVDFSADGQTLASAGEDGAVKLWNLDGTLIRTLIEHKGRVWGVSFSPDGQILASSSDDKTIKLWQWNFQLAKILQGHQNIVHDVDFSPKGNAIATASADKTIKLWNLEGQELGTLRGHNYAIWGLAWSPDGQMIATGSEYGNIKLWNFNHKKELLTIVGNKHKATSVSWSPDSQTLASASEDGTVKLWNVEGQELVTLKGHDEQVTSVSWSPNGQIIAASSENKTVKLWNVEGQELVTLKGHDGQVWSVAWSPDGKMLASASADRTVKLWNVEGQELVTLKGHDGHVWSVTWSPDGKMLASASADKTVKLWNLEGQELGTLTGYDPAKLFDVSFSPDGSKIVAASKNHTAIVWDLTALGDLEALQVRGCNWVRDYLKTNPNVSQSDRHLCDGIGDSVL
ncbi:MAG: AAA-like domain-containing protein [Pleurocapsa sp. MO_226.B13]|nr:AAA-like domain-containing protein [Pleurocapsa sp. MO_226.B13]